MRENMNQEIMQILGQMNQQHENLQEQLKLVEQQIRELEQFKDEISVLDKHKSETIIASLGKSVFAPVKFIPSEKMFVEIGAGYFVRKTSDETLIVIDEQEKKLKEFKVHLSSELSSLTEQLESIINQTQRV